MQLRIDARQNRVRILDAATEAFAAMGLSTEMKVIAERAGVAVGTLYAHFPSKDALLTAVVTGAVQAAMDGARVAESCADPVAALRALVAQAFATAERYGWVLEAMLTGQLPPASQAMIRAEVREEDGARYRNRFRRLLQRCIDQGSMRPDLDVAVAAGLLESATLPWIYGRVRGDRGPEEAATAVVDTFLRGAGPSPVE